MNVETVPRTLAIAAAVALFCSAMVSGAVYLLRPIQQGYVLLDRNRTILEAAGKLPPGELGDREIIARFLDLEAHVVDIASGNYVPGLDGHNFDHWVTGDEGAEQTDDGIAAAERVPVYLVRHNGTLRRIVLPVHGPGMWSTIYGFVALDADLSTVRDLLIYEHGETPGIGDRIEDPAWRANWRGKRVYDDDGTLRLDVVRGADGEFEVDLISGASVTADGVGDIVQRWFSDDGYRRYLDRLHREQTP